MSRPCNKHPLCNERDLVDLYGKPITDPKAFLSRANEVCAMFVHLLRLEPSATATTLKCKHLLDAVEASFLRQDNRVERTDEPQGLDESGHGPEDGQTIARFRLCPDHARQLGRGSIVVSYYIVCYPESAVPPPDLVWAVGSVAHHASWSLPLLVVLLRCWALDLADIKGVDDAVTGVRDIISHRLGDDCGARGNLALPLYVLVSVLDGRKRQATEEESARKAGREFTYRPMDTILREHDIADASLASCALEYCLMMRAAKTKRSSSGPSSGSRATANRSWFREGF